MTKWLLLPVVGALRTTEPPVASRGRRAGLLGAGVAVLGGRAAAARATPPPRGKTLVDVAIDRLDVVPVFAVTSPDGAPYFTEFDGKLGRGYFYTERADAEAALPALASAGVAPDGQAVVTSASLGRAWRLSTVGSVVLGGRLAIRAAARELANARRLAPDFADGDVPLFYDRRLSINAAGGDGSALRLPLFLKQRDCEALWERALGKTAARLDEEDRVVAKAEIQLQVTSLANIFAQMSQGAAESDAVLLVSSEAGSSIQTR